MLFVTIETIFTLHKNLQFKNRRPYNDERGPLYECSTTAQVDPGTVTGAIIKIVKIV